MAPGAGVNSKNRSTLQQMIKNISVWVITFEYEEDWDTKLKRWTWKLEIFENFNKRRPKCSWWNEWW